MAPPAIFVTGGRSQGKTTVMKRVTERSRRCVWVNCEENHRSLVLFEAILSQMRPNASKSAIFCENSVVFSTQLRKTIDDRLKISPHERADIDPAHFLVFWVSDLPAMDYTY